MAAASIDKLLQIMRELRDPQTGCAWNCAQDLNSLMPYILEEAYEVCQAITALDFENLQTELGDLLLQLVFCAQICSEQNLFDFADIAEQLAAKLISRHPHVFAGESCADAEAVSRLWEERKAAQAASALDVGGDFLQDCNAKLPAQMPALMRAQKLQKRAAGVGFDWHEPLAVIDKLSEELEELRVEITAGNRAAARGELADLLFVCANMARHLDCDAEQLVAAANRKFIRRFDATVANLRAANIDFRKASLAQYNQAWDIVKTKE